MALGRHRHASRPPPQVNRVVDLIFSTDLILQFFLMFPATDPEQGVRWVDSRGQIVKNYVCGWRGRAVTSVTAPADVAALAGVAALADVAALASVAGRPRASLLAAESLVARGAASERPLPPRRAGLASTSSPSSLSPSTL